MAQAVSVYRWDDAGAPQITDGKPNEYLDVIKKCLVEGYGDKQPLGWVILDEALPEESPFLAIKNNESVGGSGGAMMFSASNNNARTIVRCQSALDYISKTEQSRLGAYFAITAGSSGTNTANKWVIIASSTAFYFIAMPEYTLNRNYFGTYSHIFFFAGDIKSFYGSDPATFITLSGRVNSTLTGWNSSINYTLTDYTVQTCGYVYALDSTQSKENTYLITYFANHAVAQSSLYNSNPEVRAISPTCLVTGGPALNQADTHGNSEILPFMRGEVPGLFVSQEYGFKGQLMPFTKLIDGVEHYSVPNANAGGTNAWINMEEWV